MESILKLRTALGWSQSELARALEVDTSTVSRWERGTHEPKKATVIFLQMLIHLKQGAEIYDAYFGLAKGVAA